MDNSIIINNGRFNVVRFFNTNKELREVLKEKIASEVRSRNILTTEDINGYNN